MPPPLALATTILLLSIITCQRNVFVSSYTILGGIDDPTLSGPKEDDSIVTEVLRHFSPPRKVKLRIQTHEPTSGRVSMAGTLWEAAPLLADYITNPASPLEAFQRMRIHEDASSNTNARLQPQPSTVVELGSGVGLTSLAAALLGCRVYATDGSPSSTRLREENFERYASDCPVAPHASMLEWGDAAAVDSLIHNQLLGQLPDVVMASDVVYAHSAREELSRTVRQLCPKGHIHGRVLIGHRWRANPVDEESFFKSFDDDFDREEVGLKFFPEDDYYRTRSMIDMKYPMSIFEMRRKC
eukprot:CAMPEP_0172316122 /NCGR_PEP_ID=MMETSP1058-20130122/27348_1 /TAXON_ID=83371 /ORGANISM="Detonula confervacea, Strain CCMP 353" /LENGTH=298 /DNA_ID=CAMNT_0013030375 /DNA_START=63 /DNA_END=959 /DNA_ORIENTATION=-